MLGKLFHMNITIRRLAQLSCCVFWHVLGVFAVRYNIIYVCYNVVPYLGKYEILTITTWSSFVAKIIVTVYHCQMAVPVAVRVYHLPTGHVLLCDDCTG